MVHYLMFTINERDKIMNYHTTHECYSCKNFARFVSYTTNVLFDEYESNTSHEERINKSEKKLKDGVHIRAVELVVEIM